MGRRIILEDDCLPVPGFFLYCEELLSRYESDNIVWQISGDNFQDGNKRGSADYYFSNYPHIWGWATWRSRWKHYDVDLTRLTKQQATAVVERVFGTPSSVEYWVSTMMDVKAGKIDTWDYQWMYTVWLNRGLCALPNINLISNLGFGSAATHTKGVDRSLANLPIADLSFPLNHPESVVGNIDADNYIKKIELAVYNSGIADLVESDSFRDKLRQERAEQQDFASAGTASQWGKEQGANLMLFGEMTSETDVYNKKRVVNYITTLFLTDIETNKRVWYGQEEIKKYIKD